LNAKRQSRGTTLAMPQRWLGVTERSSRMP
jgi:hypothetical protein